jgi:hypothetical protein
MHAAMDCLWMLLDFLTPKPLADILVVFRIRPPWNTSRPCWIRFLNDVVIIAGRFIMCSGITNVYDRKAVGHVFTKPVRIEGTTQIFFLPVSCFSS